MNFTTSDIIYLGLISVVVSFIIGLLLRRKAPATNGARTAKNAQTVFGDLGQHNGHSFYHVGLFSKPTYSNSSGIPLLIGGLQCEKCGICISDEEQKQAQSYLKCKPLFVEEPEIVEEDPDGEMEYHEHHWTNGNLPLLSVCAVCSQPCGQEPKLIDYICGLCHRCVHEKCLGNFMAALATRQCDLGIYGKYAIPPWCVRASASKPGRMLKRKSKLYLKRISSKGYDSANDSWQPVFVFSNRSSGNSDGEIILHAFRQSMNPICQVFDLSTHRNPAAILSVMNNLLPHDVKTMIIIAAGGDGTVRWLANAIFQLRDEFESRQRTPVIAVLPLGTGNDLARCLGLGGGHVGPFDVEEYIKETLNACKPVKLDRWKVEITQLESEDGIELSDTGVVRKSSRLLALKNWHLPAIVKSPANTLFLYNYLSIGADASVTLSFAQQRDATPWLCNSRLVNKLIYGIYGLFDMFQRECHDLHQNIRLSLDGKVIENLPPFEAIILLNISSWGGGCRLWESGQMADGNFKKQQYDDGLIEVLAVNGSLQIAQLMAGFGEPLRIGQASKVCIDLLKKFPVQVDGEAWKQGAPSRIVVTCNGKVDVLARTDADDKND